MKKSLSPFLILTSAAAFSGSSFVYTTTRGGGANTKTDLSACRWSQMKDERFQLHRSNGKGIINALQTGLDLARGEFISRMDADS